MHVDKYRQWVVYEKKPVLTDAISDFFNASSEMYNLTN